MDDKSKKASLRGRGRELMRGLNPSAEDETRKNEQESPFFEDEDAVLSWMETSPPPEPAPPEAAPPLTEDEIFAEPNFDEFFVEQPDESTLILPSEESEAPKAQSLEEIFAEPDPPFQELFGDMVSVEDSARKVAVAEPEYPVPEITAEPDFDESLAAMEVEEEVLEPEEFDLEGLLASHSEERPVMGLPLGLSERRREDIPNWYQEAEEPAVAPPVLEPLETLHEEAMPSPLPTSERDTAFGIGSPQDVLESPVETPMLLIPEEEKPLTRSADFAEEEVEETEAIPPIENQIRPVNLAGKRVERPAVAEITPSEPEYLPEYEQLLPTEEIPMPEQEFWEASEPEEVLIPAPQEDVELGGVGEEAAEEDESVHRTGLFLPEETAQPADPFTREPPARKPARELFVPQEQPSDSDLLKFFVDDTRMRELYSQIEALYEEIVASVRGERGRTDVYQEELLQASNLLLLSRENYDEARAIVYRIRADLARERRVAEDIARYRPTITIVYIAMGLLFPVFILLGGLFTSVAESVDVPWFGQAYYPAMAGYLGALLFSVNTLYKHTEVEQDFDPVRLNWYLINPLMGLLTGFLVYLFIWTTVETSLSGNVSEVTGQSAMAMLLAAAAGYNQNIVRGILGSVQNRFSGSSKTSTPQEKT